MTPNNLLYCEHCRNYTNHTFVVNVGVCKVCIKTNKKPEARFSISKLFVVLKKFSYGILTSSGLSDRNQGS